jgi:cysteine synthase A
MRSLGAEVVLAPQAEGSRPGHVTGEDLALVDECARRLTHEVARRLAREGCLASNGSAAS